MEVTAKHALSDPRNVRYPERCIACDKPFIEGDLVYSDASGGTIHAACCGPEREGYTNTEGRPLNPGEPIPAPWKWSRAVGE